MSAKGLTPSVILRLAAYGLLSSIAICSWAYEFNGSWSVLVGAIGLVVVVVAAIFLFRRSVKWSIAAGLVVALGLLSGWYLYAASFPQADSIQNYVSDSYRVTGTIVSIDQSENSQQWILDDVDLSGRLVSDRMKVSAPLFPDFRFGDVVSFRCNLQAPEPFNGFRYDRYLASKNIYATCFLHEAPLLLDSGQGSPILARLLTWRTATIQKIDQTFGEPHASLLAGLLLGEQRFTQVWEDKFIATGTSHIVAASGYNVAVVTFLIFGLLIYLGLTRPRAFAFIFAAIIGYVILAGAEAAVVRAGVMGAIVLLSRQLGRKSTMTNVLLLTAGLMLVFNPRLLRDDVGFQLSMLSTIALIYFAPLLDQKLKFIPETFTLRESLTATLAATLFTLPLVFVSFGQVSIISPIVNLLILPTIPYTMAFGALATTASTISLSLGAWLSGPAWALLSFVLWVIEHMSALSITTIQIPTKSAYGLSIIVTVLIIILWRLLSRKASSQPSL